MPVSPLITQGGPGGSGPAQNEKGSKTSSSSWVGSLCTLGPSTLKPNREQL
jgi:hypothetical protein